MQGNHLQKDLLMFRRLLHNLLPSLQEVHAAAAVHSFHHQGVEDLKDYNLVIFSTTFDDCTAVS